MKKNIYSLLLQTSSLSPGLLNSKTAKKIHKFLTTKLKNKGKNRRYLHVSHHPKIGNKIIKNVNAENLEI